MKQRIHYTDTAVVFTCCAALILTEYVDKAVILLLIQIIAAAILLLTSDKVLYAAELAVPLTVLFFPKAIVFIPLAVYFSASSHHKLPIIIEAFMLVLSISVVGAEGGVLFSAALSLTAAFLGMRSAELIRRSEELKHMRDSDTELQLALSRRNKDLLAKQDDEVNIATLKERNRIAREIHDNVGHLLSRALLQSGALIAVTDKEKLPVQYTQTAALKETLTSAMNSIRESVHGLRDDSIDLHHSIKEAAESVKLRFNVMTELDFSEKMPANVKLSFIAIIKEALSNSVKYSSGDTVRIVIREHPALYQLSITDNGASAHEDRGSGMGLNNMRERTEALGGIFRVDTEDGFRIFISVKRVMEES